MSVTATEVATGRAAVFLQRSNDRPLPTPNRSSTIFKDVELGADHVLASAAIPVLFPPCTSRRRSAAMALFARASLCRPRFI